MPKNIIAKAGPLGCKHCMGAHPLNFLITMAFQPIVDLRDNTIFAYEALVRGADGSGAGEVLSWINEDNRYTFDQTCRVKAIELAARLGLDTKLSINFLPNAVYRPETCIRATLQAATEFDINIEQLMFEVTEAEPVRDPEHLGNIFEKYQDIGFTTAIDDFGAGFAGLNLLSKFQPHVIKLDMELCQDIGRDQTKQTITAGIVATARQLGIEVIAEGIETLEDLQALQNMGIYLFQGYLFSPPQIEALPIPNLAGLGLAAVGSAANPTIF